MPSVQRCREVLDATWTTVNEMAEAGRLEAWMDEELGDLGSSIRAAINSNTLTYRYVLPTQLVSKVADPTVDAQSLQAGSGQEGAAAPRAREPAVGIRSDDGSVDANPGRFFSAIVDPIQDLLI